MKRITQLIISLLIISCSNETTNKKSFLLNKVDRSITGINFINEIKENEKFNIVNYLYYYNGGGVAIGDINNDKLPDIYFVSNRGKNKLFLNQGNLKFKDISKSSGTEGNSEWNTGVTMVDINNDGYLDIYVCAVSKILGYQGNNELFINNGDGTFREESKKYGLDLKGYATQAYFFDYDKDNDLDVYIVNHALHTKNSHGPSYIRKKRVDYIGDRLLRNDDQKFIDVSQEAKIYGGANGYGLSASIGDINNDGLDDIYVCNDFHEDDYYYINNGDGTFRNELSKTFTYTSRFSMGSDIADINNDGNLDLITLDMLPYDEKIVKESDGDVSYNTQSFLLNQGYKKQYARNMLQINQDGNYFYETGLYNNVAATDWSWSPLFADFDNDTRQDLFITNGVYKRPNNLDFMKYLSNSFKSKSRNNKDWLIKSLEAMPTGEAPNQVFQNNSSQLINKTGNWIEETPTLSNGAAYADLDLDGDLDIVVNNLNDYASVYENNSSSLNNHKSISITLNYKDKNLRGIGSKVYVHTEKTVQYKQLFSSRGFISSIEPKLHFGLSENNNIDSIIVVWPDQVKQKIQTKITDKEIVIDYKNTDLLATSDKQNLHPPLFEKVNLISHKHTEDNYNDFDIQKLIPYKVSTQGPAVAIEDINNDGIDDIYIGSASYKKSKLFIGTSDGYREIAIPEIEKDSISEDINAIFVDIDNDNDLDLVVGSGTISKKDSLYLNDRVYINKGNNTFTKMNDFPQNRLNTAVLSPYDYDGDGDTDIFVGNRSNPSNFGEKVNSYILKNIGNGRFEKDPNFSLNSMVTNAIWSDINNDNIKDLLVATEWDYPRVYINNNGNMSEIKGLESLLGLWQSITSYDIDNDGDKDIILGNWGLNTKFRATPSKPIKMYYSDFDQNGQTESILSHYKQNQYYTINSKDELASQLPIINKLYPDYLSFSKETTDNFIKKLNPSSVEISEVNTLASGYILNNENTFNNFIEFPKQLQLTTINCFLEYDFNKIGKEQLLTAGNFNGLNTYHGAFNSKSLFLISPIDNQKKPIYQITPELNSDFYGKQIEKNYLLKRKKETYLLTIPNNDSIKIYKINSTKIN